MCGWTARTCERCSQIWQWDSLVVLSWKHLFLGSQWNIASPQICGRVALFREFSKITSAPDLPIQYNLSRHIGQLWSRKSPLRLISKLVEKEFLIKTSWVASRSRFDGYITFLVSNSMTAIGGMDLARTECGSWEM